MQREHIRRGFSIHQKVVLEIDFSGCLWGYTEITIVPTSRDLKTIHLHSRQCTIHSVTVASHPAEFVHHDPLSNLNIANSQDCHNHPELKRKIYSALQEGDEGELSIAIPKEVQLKQSGSVSTGLDVVSEAATPEPQTPGQPFHMPAFIHQFSPVVVHITYSLRNPVDGFEFIFPNDAYPYRVPHVYTTPSSPDAARCWVPCVDNLWEKSTWEFEFVVPRYLAERDHNEDVEDPQDDNPTLVICSGEFIEQVSHPYNSNKTIFLFSQPVLTSVQHIAFAAGPFHLYNIPMESSEENSGASQVPMQAFCLPGHENLLKSSVSFLRLAMTFYSTEFGSYPFSSHKLVFVDELPTQRFDTATLSLVSVDLLHGDDAIDQVFETRQALSHALACQWVGINIQQKTWSDTWLVNGLGLYITGLFIRKLLGNNEYRFRLKKDMQRVLAWDNGAMPPICQPHSLDPPDSATLPFINLKGPLVLHILDRRLGKSGTSVALSRVLPKLFLSAISGELQNNLISTHAFLRTCRRVSGVDLRSFADQWIYGSGCPAFGFSASFNRKKMAVEITMRQEAPAFKALEHNDVSRTLMKPAPFFEGQMTIRIHEADGTPYEHVLDIRTPFKRYEVPFNTKYKRVRRNTKRYLARQAAAQAAAEGDADAAEAIGMIDMGFGLEVWENEAERENWKVADWTEEDEATMSGATYEWIRMDADFEWIAAIAFEQPDFMWVSQLQRDRDVVAQLEAVYALARQPTAIVSSTLTKTVLVSNYYFRIRSEAALALVQCAISRIDFLGLFHLFKLFLKYCYEPEDPNQDLFAHTYVPKPNDFSDLADYFVRKNLISAISRVRFDNGKSPSVVRQFLIDQLRYNDNTANPYADAFYICSLLSSLACAAVSTALPERGELFPTEARSEQTAEDADLLKRAMAEVERYRSMDRLIPSVHNVVTTAALEFYLMLGLANLIPSHPRIFFPLTREGNYTQVRIAAFDGVFLTKWYTPQIMRYILAVMANDSSRIVRRYVARNACQSLALLVTMGEMKTSVKENESLLIEEDGNAAEKTKEAKKSDMDMMIKVLRKDREVGKNDVLREFLMPIALAPDVDHEVRWCVLKLADILIRGVEEAPPKVTIHLPPTPIVETPPPPPVPKVVPKQRVKSGGPAKSPSVPPTPRLKFGPLVPKPDVLPSTPALNGDHSKRSVAFTPSDVASKVKAKGKPVKPGRPAHVPKAQSAGMSLPDLKASRNALKKLKAHKHATLFLQPVDPVRDRAPNYFEIIKDPMDFSTMTAKLEAGMYKSRDEFEKDFHLMIDNAKQYNQAGSFAYNEALAMEIFFDKLWQRTIKTLEAAAGHAPVPKDIPQPPSVVPRGSQAQAGAPASSLADGQTANVSRPTIKFKLGAAESGPSEGPKPQPSKPKGRKAKAVDMPPPAYVDDGSHDLLQEVIAIEQEKNERRQRAVVEKEVPREIVTTAVKRKVSSSDVEDEEILALATPSKREKHSSPDLSPPPIEELAITMAVVPEVGNALLPVPPSPSPLPKPAQITPKPKIVVGKPKKDKAKGSTTAAAVESPRPSAKGKEKEKDKDKDKERQRDREKEAERDRDRLGIINGKEETSMASPSSSKPKRSPVQPTPVNDKKCRDILRTLGKVEGGALFAQPVDPIRDGCPTYYDEIKEPMDFATMGQKLTDGRYTTMEEYARDVDLIFNNCRKFNPATTYPVQCADAVEKIFKKEWAKAMERKLSWSEKRSLQGLMTTIVKEPISWVFREPVDPIQLGIPTYFDVIPKKDARDLRTIRTKLDSDKYGSIDALEEDIDLMVHNAVTFNGADSEVGKLAYAVQNRVKDLLANIKSGTVKKRKDGDKSNPQPTKKLKLG